VLVVLLDSLQAMLQGQMQLQVAIGHSVARCWNRGGSPPVLRVGRGRTEL
jgi:hypothetical protein